MPGMDGFTLVERLRQQTDLGRITIMMLTSAGQRGDAARCRELGIAAYLVKPIVQSQLLDAVLNVLAATAREARTPRVQTKKVGLQGGPQGPASEACRTPLVTRHSLRETRQLQRILLAEDNVVNQVLASRLLEKHGHSVVVVNNGRSALEALDNEKFDLVLMDVSMPEMDGLETVAAIRAREGARGFHMPIIAMTAHAMKGDRERCLEAGMDAYISKPIQPRELFEAIKLVSLVSAQQKGLVACKPA
jgi:CheY-like chemotaxis protein